MCCVLVWDVSMISLASVKHPRHKSRDSMANSGPSSKLISLVILGRMLQGSNVPQALIPTSISRRRTRVDQCVSLVQLIWLQHEKGFVHAHHMLYISRQCVDYEQIAYFAIFRSFSMIVDAAILSPVRKKLIPAIQESQKNQAI